MSTGSDAVTRIGPQTVVQRAGDLVVIADARTGQEVALQVQDAARLSTALPYLLTGAHGVQDIAAERVRQISHGHTRSWDLNGGTEHALDIIRVARAHLLTTATQVQALGSDAETLRVHDVIRRGNLAVPPGYPAAWRWTPDVDPQVNLRRAGALTAAVMDVLAVMAAVGAAQ